MLKKLGVFKDFNDGSLKSVFENNNNEIIEMTLLKNRESADVVCVPTHHYCNLKCKMCHLTKEGIDKGMVKIRADEFLEALYNTVKVNTERRTNNGKLLISFMGVGEPLLNLELIRKVYENEEKIKKDLGYEAVGYAMSTMMPKEEKMEELEAIVKETGLPIKVHFSLHSPNDNIREELIPSSEYSVRSNISHLLDYRNMFLNDRRLMRDFLKVHRNSYPVEIHYTLIKGVNDSEEELENLCNILAICKLPIKFIKFNPKEDMEISQKEEEWVKKLKEIKGLLVKRYAPPGKEIGSSCGEFTKHYYLSNLESEEDKKEFEEWKEKHQIFEKYRKNNLSWDEYFMAVAKLSSMRSKDPSTQVGACIASSDNRILSVGYNGAPNGFADELFPWDREGTPLETKYMYVVHAERNAILNYRGNRKDFEGAKLYVDLFPCNECAKEIVQSGIKEVIYLSDKYANTEGTIASKRIFDMCGVSYRQLNAEHQKEFKLSLKL